jgi:hypothetical protein
VKKLIDFIRKNKRFSIIATIWFVIFVLFVVLLLKTIRFGYLTDWVAITAFATWVLAGGVLVAIWQISETRRSTNAQIAMDIFKELRSDEALQSLKTIYNREDNSPDKLNDTDKEKITLILDMFEVLGILVDKEIVDKDIAIHAFGGASALRCWYSLHNYIKIIGNERGPYKLNFEIYTRRCLEYFLKKGIDVKLTYGGKNGEKKTVDIIAELQKPEFKPRTREEIEKELKKQKSN